VEDWVWGRIATACCFVPALLYAGIFLCRKETSLRPRTMVSLLAFGVLVRLALVWFFPLHMTAIVLSVLVGLIVLGHFLAGIAPFHVHASEESLRAEIDEACRRLFIQKEEPRPGELHLSAKGKTVVLVIVAQGGSFTLIFLPRVREMGKLSLFVNWLAKRYPGPIPRIRVDLTRR